MISEFSQSLKKVSFLMRLPVAKPIVRMLEGGDSSHHGLRKARTMGSSFLACSKFRELSRSAPSSVGTTAFRLSASLEKSSIAQTLDNQDFIPGRM